MKEIWKPIDWIDEIPKDKYQVSNLGRVYNIYTKKFLCKTFRADVTQWYINLNNHLQNSANKNSHYVAYPLIKAIAIAFVQMPDGYTMTDVKLLKIGYIDHDINNIHATNLRWDVKSLVKLSNVPIEKQFLIVELLLKYRNNRTNAELSDIIYNETHVKASINLISALCNERYGEDSIIGKKFGLIGKTIKEVSDTRDKLLSPIIGKCLQDGTRNGEERWVWLEYPRVKKEKYIISDHGQIMNDKGQMLSIHMNQGLCNVLLKNDNNYTTTFVVARLVAYHFCDFPPGIEEHEIKNIIVKYRDCNSLNLYYKNLYWTTPQGIRKSGLEIDTIREITVYTIELYKSGKSLLDICQFINEKFGTNYTITKFRDMLSKFSTKFENSCSVLDIDMNQLKIRERKCLTNDDVKQICMLLIKHNGDINVTLKDTLLIGIKVNNTQIRNIKNKRTFQKISDEYFTDETWKQNNGEDN